MEIIEKFLRYVSFDTQSDENSPSQPSTGKQLVFLKSLCDELRQMGAEASLDEYGYVMARIPANVGNVPAIGFIAHVDTSPDAAGRDVKPQVIRHYDGGRILLEGSGDCLDPSDFPELGDYVDQTIITTDGTTLLGADDKAGVAEIMAAAEHLMAHPEIRHGDICIAFTPDEEIGRGVAKFDVRRFGATYAYTLDGGALGELEFENFNASSADVTIRGRNVHPGTAKGRMINSMRVAMELDAMIPASQRPETTDGYEGFFHLTDVRGDVEKTLLRYIVRDHDEARFAAKQELLETICRKVNEKYGDGTATLTVKHQYSNMKRMVEPHGKIIEIAKRAMEDAGVEPKVQPIRGGTDGANLSFMGLPCPNIFTGGHNFHGRFEFIPLESMEKAVEVILNIIAKFAD